MFNMNVKVELYNKTIGLSYERRNVVNEMNGNDE